MELGTDTSGHRSAESAKSIGAARPSWVNLPEGAFEVGKGTGWFFPWIRRKEKGPVSPFPSLVAYVLARWLGSSLSEVAAYMGRDAATVGDRGRC